MTNASSPTRKQRARLTRTFDGGIHMERLLIAVTILVAIGSALAFTHGQRRTLEKQEALQAIQQTEVLHQQTAEAQRKLRESLDQDSAVKTTILEGLQLSIEIQPQWIENSEITVFQLNLEKSLGERFLVDNFDQTSILYVNNRPYKLLQKPTGLQQREVLEAETASRHCIHRLDHSISLDSLLMVEWCNYNSRTGNMEKLRTKPFRYAKDNASNK